MPWLFNFGDEAIEDYMDSLAVKNDTINKKLLKTMVETYSRRVEIYGVDVDISGEVNSILRKIESQYEVDDGPEPVEVSFDIGEDEQDDWQSQREIFNMVQEVADPRFFRDYDGESINKIVGLIGKGDATREIIANIKTEPGLDELASQFVERSVKSE